MNRIFTNKKTLVFLIVVFIVTGFLFRLKTSSHTTSVRKEVSDTNTQDETGQVKLELTKTKHNEEKSISNLPTQNAFSSSSVSDNDSLHQKITTLSHYESLEQETRGREIIDRLQNNFDGLEKVSYQIQWESQMKDDGKTSFLAEVKFKRPFYYFEKGTGGRVYTYFSEGVFEQFTYDAQAHDFAGKSEVPPLEAVDEAGFLERFPLRILQTKNGTLLGEEIVTDPNGNQVACEVVGNGRWKIYVAKNSNVVIRADYYREQGKTDDVLVSLSDFKYSKVEIGENKSGEKKVMDFPVSFKALVPSSNWAYKCNVLNLQVNNGCSFDDSVFKFGLELNQMPEFK